MNNEFFGESVTNENIGGIEDIFIDLLLSLSSMSETPSVEIVYDHNRRCGLVAEELCKHLDVDQLCDADKALFSSSPKIIKYMSTACMLHDIGKSQTPAELLMKPSGLSTAEMQMMKEHTTFPDDTLFENFAGTNNVFIQLLQACVRSHHELYNGLGYPDGLVATDIPFIGRLMAVIDSLDNIISETFYSKANTFETAQQIIHSNSGIRFDPVIVHALDKAKDGIKAIYEQ
ncbi:HD-GYP domain-containing protein [Vibrio algivorus]|uniref:HD domain-containing protein n=1 Tax=Vibrio algivorus TaxID=1667024 RepID=A0A557P2L7_9VIBR|nr:HD domain-containing phosphohydrolase [Vibrio algivorus]TVO34913.1 HD domain-containing protein [Vibrio algivorus]